MAAVEDVPGQVIKRLSFGDMSSCLEAGQTMESAFQKEVLEGREGAGLEMENDENAYKHAGAVQYSGQAFRDRQKLHHRALEEIRSTSSRFNALEEAAKAEYRESGPGKLASLKDTFSKSKFEYVELETKEHFVRAIAEEGDRVLAGEEVKGSFLLEGVVGNQKAKVQEFKKLKQETGASINSIIDQIAAEMSELEKEQESVATEMEACEGALQSWEQAQAALAAAEESESKEDLEGVYSQQEAQLQKLVQQESLAREAGIQAERDAEQTAAQIAELQARLQDAEAESLHLKEAAEQVGTVSKSTEKYEQLLEVLHDLAGVHVTERSDTQMQFRVTTHISDKSGRRKQAEIEHDLVVDLDEQTRDIQDARLTPADVDIADIVDTVRGSQRLDALVREIRQRMSCYALRASQVARASRTTKFKMKTFKTNIIQATLPTSRIIAFIIAPYDWPSPGVSLQLESLLTQSGGAAFKDDILERIQEDFNQSKAAQEGDLIPCLQSLEAKLCEMELA